MKIGILGGSFNPIHNGHIMLANAVAAAVGLKQVIIIPAAVAPNKTGYCISDEHRLNMCRIAVQNSDLLSVSATELERGGISYTVDTLTELKVQYPSDEFYLIMGADMFVTLEHWRNYKTILTLAVICTVPRDNIDICRLKAYSQKIINDGGRVVITPVIPCPISSTAVRKSAWLYEDVTATVGKNVAAYIKTNNLYTECCNMEKIEQYYANIPEYTQMLKNRLSQKRFTHTVNVSAEAVRLAKKYGADEKKAAVAGLLHDIMKETTDAEQLYYMQSHGMELTDVELSTPKLWHAMSGACYVKNTLGIEDEDIINAIKYHTTARADMSLLEKIIHLADYTSAERDYDGADDMRVAVDVSLEYAMEAALLFSITDLSSRGRVIHTDTVNAYNQTVMQKAGK